MSMKLRNNLLIICVGLAASLHNFGRYDDQYKEYVKSTQWKKLQQTTLLQNPLYFRLETIDIHKKNAPCLDGIACQKLALKYGYLNFL